MKNLFFLISLVFRLIFSRKRGHKTISQFQKIHTETQLLFSTEEIRIFLFKLHSVVGKRLNLVVKLHFAYNRDEEKKNCRRFSISFDIRRARTIVKCIHSSITTICERKCDDCCLRSAVHILRFFECTNVCAMYLQKKIFLSLYMSVNNHVVNVYFRSIIS